MAGLAGFTGSRARSFSWLPVVSEGPALLPPVPQHEVEPWLADQTSRTQRCHSVGGGSACLLSQPPSTSAFIKQWEKLASKFTWSNSESKVPSIDSSPTDERDQRAMSSCYVLFAAALGNLEWLRFCLNPDLPTNNGQDFREIPADNKGFTAIHFAAQSGKLECLKVLVEEYKFPVDLPTNNGQTPLHLAIHRENKTTVLPCIHYLLKCGAAVNTQTCNGSTPLHLAAREDLLSCVKVLVKSGANVHARDAMGCKPIDYCKIWNYRVCARFLKDAMWKRDKKDFACEMEKLKRLKGQLALMEQDYLTEQQKKHQILKEADFKKWLHHKLLPRGQSLIHNTEQVPRAPPWAVPFYRTPKPSKSFHPFPRMHLQQKPPPKLKPLVTPTPTYKQPRVRQPKLWDPSINPARPPTTQISFTQGIGLSVHPDPSLEHDFGRFLQIRSDGHGGARLRTVAGKQVAPVPQLPLEVIVHELYPQVRPCRMKVPQGFHSVSIWDVDRKQHMSGTFWTDTLAMNLRETFDEAFLAAVRAHRGLPILPSLQPPP